jgi:hypothetical protein
MSLNLLFLLFYLIKIKYKIMRHIQVLSLKYFYLKNLLKNNINYILKFHLII